LCLGLWFAMARFLPCMRNAFYRQNACMMKGLWLAYQCKKRNVVGQYLAAEMVHEAPRVNVPFMTKLRVRGKRYMREAALTWAVVLGIYERI